MQSRSPGWSVTGRGFERVLRGFRFRLVGGDLAQDVLQDAAIAVVVGFAGGIDAEYCIEGLGGAVF